MRRQTDHIMIFKEPIIYGNLLNRYKRFFMDVRLESGEIIVAHTPNTGSMLGLLTKENPVMLTKNTDPKRKTQYTVQAVCVSGNWVGVNTQLPNKLILNSLNHELLTNINNYQEARSEKPYGLNERSRVDLYFSQGADGAPPLYLEIKNVTLKEEEFAQFPDTKSERAKKHLLDLMGVLKENSRAALYFVVQRQDCLFFKAARHIDKDYAELLDKAQKEGLEIRALCAKIDGRGLALTHEIPCIFAA